MLNREETEEIFADEFSKLNIPDDIPRDKVVNLFCRSAEDYYYEWLKDTFVGWSNFGKPDWDWIRFKLGIKK